MYTKRAFVDNETRNTSNPFFELIQSFQSTRDLQNRISRPAKIISDGLEFVGSGIKKIDLILSNRDGTLNDSNDGDDSIENCFVKLKP
jgi:hypothetical protein